jgi:hypothetical protein
MLGQLACSELQREGIEFDLTALPRLSSLRPHLGVESMSVTVEAEGVVATGHGTVPHVDPGLGFALPISGILPYWLMLSRMELARAVEAQQPVFEAKPAAEDVETEAERRKRERDGRR